MVLVAMDESKAGFRHGKAKIEQQLNQKKCQNEKRRREQESVYMEELADFFVGNDVTGSFNMIRQDKCAILQETISQLKHITNQDTGIDVIQQGQVTSSNISGSVVTNDVVGPLLLEALDGFLFIIDPQKTIEFVSDNVTNYLKFSRDDVVGSNLYSLIHVEDHDDLSAYLQTAFTSSSLSTGDNKRCFYCRMLVKCLDNDDQQTPSSKQYENMQLLPLRHPLDIESAFGSDDADSGQASGCMVCVARRCSPPEKSLAKVGMQQFTTKQNLNGLVLACETSNGNDSDCVNLDLVGKNILEFCFDKDRHSVIDHHKQVLKTGSNTSGVYRFCLADQKYVFIQTNSKLFKNPSSGRAEFIMSTHSIVRKCDGALTGSASSDLMQQIISSSGERDDDKSDHVSNDSSVFSCVGQLLKDNIGDIRRLLPETFDQLYPDIVCSGSLDTHESSSQDTTINGFGHGSRRPSDVSTVDSVARKSVDGSQPQADQPAKTPAVLQSLAIKIPNESQKRVLSLKYPSSLLSKRRRPNVQALSNSHLIDLLLVNDEDENDDPEETETKQQQWVQSTSYDDDPPDSSTVVSSSREPMQSNDDGDGVHSIGNEAASVTIDKHGDGNKVSLLQLLLNDGKAEEPKRKSGQSLLRRLLSPAPECQVTTTEPIDDTDDPKCSKIPKSADSSSVSSLTPFQFQSPSTPVVSIHTSTSPSVAVSTCSTIDSPVVTDVAPVPRAVENVTLLNNAKPADDEDSMLMAVLEKIIMNSDTIEDLDNIFAGADELTSQLLNTSGAAATSVNSAHLSSAASGQAVQTGVLNQSSLAVLNREFPQQVRHQPSGVHNVVGSFGGQSQGAASYQAVNKSAEHQPFTGNTLSQSAGQHIMTQKAPCTPLANSAAMSNLAGLLQNEDSLGELGRQCATSQGVSGQLVGQRNMMQKALHNYRQGLNMESSVQHHSAAYRQDSWNQGDPHAAAHSGQSVLSGGRQESGLLLDGQATGTAGNLYCGVQKPIRSFNSSLGQTMPVERSLPKYQDWNNSSASLSQRFSNQQVNSFDVSIGICGVSQHSMPTSHHTEQAMVSGHVVAPCISTPSMSGRRNMASTVSMNQMATLQQHHLQQQIAVSRHQVQLDTQQTGYNWTVHQSERQHASQFVGQSCNIVQGNVAQHCSLQQQQQPSLQQQQQQHQQTSVSFVRHQLSKPLEMSQQYPLSYYQQQQKQQQQQYLEQWVVSQQQYNTFCSIPGDNINNGQCQQ